MKISGIGASAGVIIKKVFKLEHKELIVTNDLITDVDFEINKLDKALDKAVEELTVIRNNTATNIDEEHALIFDAHIQIVRDPEMRRQVTELIQKDSYNVTYAYSTASETFAQIFDSMEDVYMRERAADIRDVQRRVVSHLLGAKLNDPTSINEEVIVVADDLTPSDTAQLNRQFVKGFITNIGGRTSHSAIMARRLEIPAIVGTNNITELVEDNDLVILDALEGVVIIKPTIDEVKFYEAKISSYLSEIKVWEKFKNKKTLTLDNHHIEITANIGSPEDIASVIKNGGEGVGLYRTEFLYMNNNNLPTEDEQYIAYKLVLQSLPGKKVIIRTLDIGGDKQLDYLPLDIELNPFLGHRALRLCLDKIDIFKTQLRALLRASNHGDLHIMFPMVATLNELRKAKEVLKECESELISSGKKIGNYKVGIMVEIPSVAILADKFAKEVDFFSIGTNDLIQYSFAADRMNQKVSYLYQPLNPSLLRLIKMVIDASHKEGIFTGMCGEMAEDKLAIPILLGLGLDEFSMSASSMLQTRHLFSKLSYKEMKHAANHAINLGTAEEVKEYMDKLLY